MSSTPEIQEELTCDECGQTGAVEIGGGQYCVECYSVSGSSCAGGGESEPIRKSQSSQSAQRGPDQPESRRNELGQRHADQQRGVRRQSGSGDGAFDPA
jgi:hypothetical protein